MRALTGLALLLGAAALVLGVVNLYEGAGGQVRVHENGRAEHDMTLDLPERD